MTEEAVLDIQKIKDRDRAALRELFDILLPRFQRISSMYLNSGDAEDSASEAIILLFSRLDRSPWDDTERFLNWCTSLARNVAKNYAATLYREEVRFKPFVSGTSAPQIEPLEAKMDLESMVAQLSQADRELLECRLEGTPMNEIAQLQKQSTLDVVQRYNRILRTFRKQGQSEVPLHT